MGYAPGRMITSRQPSSLRAVAVAAVALLVSGASHFAFIEYLPVMRLTGRAIVAPEGVEDVPVRVEDVRVLEHRESYPELQKFVPSDPNQVADINREVETFDLTPNLNPLEQSVEPSAPLAGADQATTSPVLPQFESSWEPRQEILAVQEKLLQDEVAAIPRQYTPDVPRVARAPDVVNPIEVPSGGDPARLLALSSRPAGESFGLAPTAPSFTGPRGKGGTPPPPPAPPTPAPNEIADILDDTMEDVTQVKAVEDLLGLRTFTFRNPQDPDYLYFRIEVYRKGIEALPVLPKEFIFLLDCSESMTNAKLKQCKEGISRALDLLHPQDVFNIMFFRDQVWMAFEPSAAVSAVMRARARTEMEPVTARGRTDVFASLQKLASMRANPARPVIAVLVTDGRPTEGLIDSSDIIESFTRLNEGKLSVFSVGGGDRANKYLLDLLSYRNRGDSLVVPLNQDIPATVLKMSGELANPVLANLTSRFTGLDEADVYPRRLTNLYLDRPLLLYGRTKATTQPVAFQVVGDSVEKRHDLVFTVDFGQTMPGGEEIRREWARHSVYHLIGEFTRTRDPGTLAKIQAICTQYNINVPYAYSLSSPVTP